MSEPHEIVLTFMPDDWAFLELQAEEMALDPTRVVAMLVRKARKAYERPATSLAGFVKDAHPDEAGQRLKEAEEAAKREAEEQRRRAIAEKKARLLAEIAELEDATQYVSPAREPDVQQDMPSLPEFDESLLREPDRPIERAVQTIIAPPRNNGPGSITAPAGVRRDLRGGDVIGDPNMNIIRRNFKHLGTG